MITNVQLSTKEQYLLKDQRTHEEQCVTKYENYANLATDAQLKAVFRSNGQKEQEHLQTINQLLEGKVPAMGGQNQSNQGNPGMNQSNQASSAQSGNSQVNNMQGASQGATSQSQQSSIERSGSTSFNLSDKEMCIDMLSTEKYVSGTYDTAIFEFSNAQIRDVLNHIQKEEQKHGEAIFAYMQSKGMYSAQ
jgi:spore coat protein CotF